MPRTPQRKPVGGRHSKKSSLKTHLKLFTRPGHTDYAAIPVALVNLNTEMLIIILFAP